jgi:hypothetical protein
LSNWDVGIPFSSGSYYLVGSGNNSLNMENIKNIIEKNNISRFEDNAVEYRKLIRELSEKMTEHSVFLKMLGGLND